MTYSILDYNWKVFEEQGNITEAIRLIVLEIANNLLLAFVTSSEVCDMPAYDINSVDNIITRLNLFDAESKSFQLLSEDFESALRDLEDDSIREKEDVFEDLKEIAEQLLCEIENRNKT